MTIFMKDLPKTQKANRKHNKIIIRKRNTQDLLVSHQELQWFVDKIKELETELVKTKRGEL
ncbi:hypothetical protein D307_gp126 [Bacillus phage Bastille]|uniref:Uncharacterized protein n=1 Tax=Bacillus phage Bastille TaxID=57477 RepID=J9PL08_9CAUD|nr:hypothetical protein D307_gp126 [Bacillus phage Bastille]AEQ34338.1 hypothetical protein [Bacillus phage Bastille]